MHSRHANYRFHIDLKGPGGQSSLFPLLSVQVNCTRWSLPLVVDLDLFHLFHEVLMATPTQGERLLQTKCIKISSQSTASNSWSDSVIRKSSQEIRSSWLETESDEEETKGMGLWLDRYVHSESDKKSAEGAIPKCKQWEWSPRLIQATLVHAYWSTPVVSSRDLAPLPEDLVAQMRLILSNDRILDQEEVNGTPSSWLRLS